MSPEWQQAAACADPTVPIKEMDKVFFPEAETKTAARYAERKYCGFCPVRAACLSWSIDNATYGLYAGTTPGQRRALARKRERVKCPACGTFDPVETIGVAQGVMVTTQFCRACASSWIISTVSVDIVEDDAYALAQDVAS